MKKSHGRKPTDDPLAAAIDRIAEQNIREGRLERRRQYCAPRRKPTSAEYRAQLIHYWTAEHARVQRLAQGDRSAWEQLARELSHRAVELLGLHREHSAGPTPEELAIRACEKLHATRYPFDVPFDIWATRILREVILETVAPQDACRGD